MGPIESEDDQVRRLQKEVDELRERVRALERKQVGELVGVDRVDDYVMEEFQTLFQTRWQVRRGRISAKRLVGNYVLFFTPRF